MEALSAAEEAGHQLALLQGRLQALLELAALLQVPVRRGEGLVVLPEMGQVPESPLLAQEAAGCWQQVA